MAPTEAFSNHGKSSNGKKSSRSPRYSQKPCFEILVTSTSKVAVPGILDLILVLQDQLVDTAQIAVAEFDVLRQLDVRRQPELGLTLRGLDVDVWPRLLPGEEVETKGSLAE